MADIFAKWTVPPGAGPAGSFADPLWIVDACAAAVTGDTVIQLVNPADREGSKYVLGIGESVSFTANHVTVRPGDSTASGVHTNVIPIVDGAASALNALSIGFSTRWQGIEVRNSGGHGIVISSVADNTIITDYIVRDSTNDGLHVVSGARNCKFVNGQAFDNGGYGHFIHGDECNFANLYGEGNSNTDVEVSGVNHFGAHLLALRNDVIPPIRFESTYGLLVHPTVVHLGGAVGGVGIEMDSASYMVCVGLMAVSEGAGSNRFTYPAAIHATNALSACMEGGVSFNNQTLDAQNFASAKNYHMETGTDPNLVGGIPFDATSQTDLTTPDILRSKRIGEEGDWRNSGAIQTGADIDSGPQLGIIEIGIIR
jgi:hypothetical protein